jgi:hypothetical protein
MSEWQRAKEQPNAPWVLAPQCHNQTAIATQSLLHVAQDAPEINTTVTERMAPRDPIDRSGIVVRR